MSTAVLTESATFVCPHGGTLSLSNGLFISPPAMDDVTVDGRRPLLSGATINGFTPACGCAFMIGGMPMPCLGFTLSPASGKLVVGGRAAYTESDAAAIAAVPSIGNGMPGLRVVDSQTDVQA